MNSGYWKTVLRCRVPTTPKPPTAAATSMHVAGNLQWTLEKSATLPGACYVKGSDSSTCVHADGVSAVGNSVTMTSAVNCNGAGHGLWTLEESATLPGGYYIPGSDGGSESGPSSGTDCGTDCGSDYGSERGSNSGTDHGTDCWHRLRLRARLQQRHPLRHRLRHRRRALRCRVHTVSGLPTAAATSMLMAPGR